MDVLLTGLGVLNTGKLHGKLDTKEIRTQYNLKVIMKDKVG